MNFEEIFNELKIAQSKAYAPYSNFKVGAVLVLKNGKYIHGCNVENAAYPSGLCAERVAMFSSVAQGVKKDDIEALAIIGDSKEPISPCGACRQVMAELLNGSTKVYLFNNDKNMKEFTVNDLLPYQFNGEDLK